MTIPTVSTAPPAPSSPSTFGTVAATFLTWLRTFATELQAMISAINALLPDIDLAASSADAAEASAASAAASAASAINAPGTNGTSTTSVTIGTGSKAFTTQTGKDFAVGQFVVVARTSDVSRYMIGQISAYNSGTGAMTVSVAYIDTAGGGTYTDWTISLTADPASITVTLRPSSISTNTTAVVGYDYIITAACTLTLPASPVAGDVVGFRNLSGGGAVVIGRNASKIMGLSEDLTLNIPAASGALEYVDSTQGWVLR